MKKQYFVLTAVTILALAAMSCGIQFVGSNPTPVPQNFDPGPQNGNPVPEGPDSGNPQNMGPQGAEPVNPSFFEQGQEPNPNGGGPGGNPGQSNIQLFTADQMTLNKGQCTNLHWQTQGGFGVKLNGQPVAPTGQQQVCPQQTTLYGLGLDSGNQMLTREITITVSGGNQNPGPVAPTATKPKKNNPDGGGSNQTPTIDLQATDLYLDEGYYVHVGVKNNSNQSGNLSFSVACSGNFTAVTGKSSPVSYSNSSITAAFNPNQERWTNSKILLDKGTGSYNLTCTISSNPDSNNSNNSVTKQLKTP